MIDANDIGVKRGSTLCVNIFRDHLCQVLWGLLARNCSFPKDHLQDISLNGHGVIFRHVFRVPSLTK